MLDTQNPNNYLYQTEHLELHILGGLKQNKLESLRVTLSINKIADYNIIRQSIDLYNDNQVEKLVRKIAERLEIGTSVTRRTLQELTKALENYRFLLIEKENQNNKPYAKEITAKEKEEAITFLKKENLLKRTNELIGKSGVIGEEINRLIMYLIFTSRKTKNPLHCISLGSSGVGKTHLQTKVSELMPQEDIIEITYLSANALYYFARAELSHKIILIEDLDGAENVLYPLRELQTKKRITKTVAHKDTQGRTRTIHLTVEGPVCIAGCTTQESIYEDNSNRSFLLYIDESKEQDKKIMNYQRMASAGKLNTEDELEVQEFLQNVQRILKPIKVINPYAEYLELPQSVFKPRRTNTHYLQFIEAITFYNQYQRKHKKDFPLRGNAVGKGEETGEIYIETTIEDIQQANELITEILLRKSDNLNGVTRNHLEKLKKYLKDNKQTSFTNAEIRRNLRVKESTLRRYNKLLLEEAYIKRIKDKTTKSYRFEIINKNEYTKLKEQIDNALNTCISAIQLATSPPTRHSKNGEVNAK